MTKQTGTNSSTRPDHGRKEWAKPSLNRLAADRAELLIGQNFDGADYS